MQRPSNKEDFLLQPAYPMYLIPASEIVQLEWLLCLNDLRDRNMTKTWSHDLDGIVIVVSHQWLAFDYPDPHQDHLKTLQRILVRLCSGEFSHLDDFWMHKVMFMTRHVPLSRSSGESTYLWLDYCCMPQINAASTQTQVNDAVCALRSIPAYVERASLLLVLVPVCKHRDTGETCNYSTWRRRGWCRLELMLTLVSLRNIRAMVCTGAEATPFIIHAFDAPRLLPGEGQFSCCFLNHTHKGKEIPCDKPVIRSVLEKFLTARAQSDGQVTKQVEGYYFTCLKDAFLAGLPSPRKQPIPADTSASDQLRLKLTWSRKHEDAAKRTGFGLMMCAAISDDDRAVKELAMEGANACQALRRDFSHLAYMIKGCVPVMAAMVFSSFQTVEALLAARANPKATAWNGFDALFVACCRSNFQNVKGWLRRFPLWNLGRDEWNIGVDCLCIAAVSGLQKKPVIELLLNHKADLTRPRLAPILCFLGQSEDSDQESLRLLLSRRCDPNVQWFPGRAVWKLLCKSTRLAGCFKSRPCLELAMLEGSTPLHMAAKRGDVALVKCLVAAQAEVQRNSKGLTPLELARSFFKIIPPALEVELLKAHCPEESKRQKGCLGMPR